MEIKDLKFGDLFVLDRKEETTRKISAYKHRNLRIDNVFDFGQLIQRFDICQFIEIVEINVIQPDKSTKQVPLIKFLKLSDKIFLYIPIIFSHMMVKL
jgi:hypothetical protein